MLKLPFRALTIISTLVLAPALVHAAGPSEMARGMAGSVAINFLREKTPTLAPFAHVRFCMKNPDDCAPAQAGAADPVTADMEGELSAVNRQVNQGIKQVNDDKDVEFGDSWEVANGEGDCEDIALAKRKELIRLGWSPRSLRIAVTRTAAGEGHAVLVVRTSKGDLVLDNRSDVVKNWQKADLIWLKIQSADNPRLWMTL